MDLTDEQKQIVTQWVHDGCELKEIQQRLGDELGIRMTYMDVRFLVIDLGLELKDNTPRREAPRQPDDEDEPEGGFDETDTLDEDGDDFGTPGSVSVELDRIVKPGSIVSGTARFSDGVQATWWLDQLGRLGLDAGQPGYTPSQEDIMAFQNAVRSALSKRGF